MLFSRSPETFLNPHLYRLSSHFWAIVLSFQFAARIPGTFYRESDKRRLHMGSEVDKHGLVDNVNRSINSSIFPFTALPRMDFAHHTLVVPFVVSFRETRSC
jgi:hypothetical protein